MVSLKSILSFGLLGISTAAAAAIAEPLPEAHAEAGSSSQRLPGCGQVDVFVAGLPPYHPLVIAQGFPPAQVDAALRADAADIIRSGYNLRVVLAGPEKPVSIYEDRLRGNIWEGTGVGYGIRGSRLPNLTIYFEDIITTYQRRAPFSQILFNYSPDSMGAAVKRRFPLNSNCTNSPGRDLGFEIYCDICSNSS